jgi:hypothetical protein
MIELTDIAWWSALQRRNTKKSPTVSDHLTPRRSW